MCKVTSGNTMKRKSKPRLLNLVPVKVKKGGVAKVAKGARVMKGAARKQFLGKLMNEVRSEVAGTTKRFVNAVKNR